MKNMYFIPFLSFFLPLFSGCSPINQTQAGSQAQQDNDAIVRKAVAGQLYKKPEELTSDDYTNLINLDLSYPAHSAISNIEPLAKLTNLRFLSLSNTQITNIEPLVGLTNLDIS